MNDSSEVKDSRSRGVEAAARMCRDCGAALTEPFGWCSTCRAAYCLECGRAHFCMPSCAGTGCHAGLCVRLFSGGVLAEAWGLPSDIP